MDREFMIRAKEHRVIQEDGTEIATWSIEQFLDGWWQKIEPIVTITDLRKSK